jgi:hypothetical protein
VRDQQRGVLVCVHRQVLVQECVPAFPPFSYGALTRHLAVYELAPTYSASTHQLTFPSESMTTIQFTIPKNVPSGQYLIRAEQVALHAAGSYGGAQVGHISLSIAVDC